jgi:DNA polymerase III epsilon subunit-like protein
MSSSGALFLLLGVAAVIIFISNTLKANKAKRLAFEEADRIRKEREKKEAWDKHLNELSEFKKNLDQMIYETDKDYYDKKAARAQKRVDKQYVSPTFHEFSKFSHDGSRYVIFDLETTGLNPARSQITEIAAIRYVHDQPVETYQTLVKLKKGTGVGPKVVELTGITTEMLKEKGIELDLALEQFLAFIGDDLLMAYNIEFDASFIEAKLKRSLPNKQKCIYQLARRKWRNRESYRLVDLIREECFEPGDGSHRALKDVELAHELLMAIVYEQY